MDYLIQHKQILGAVNLVAVVTGSAINVKVMYMAVGRWKEETQTANEEGE